MAAHFILVLVCRLAAIHEAVVLICLENTGISTAYE